MEFDTSKASSARVYDYLIGGTHNFEADQIVARQIAVSMPHMAQAARLNRLFLGYAARQLAEAEFTCYIDLSTGLPTEGALHEFVPSSARILYNDIDPEAVAYGRQIVDDWANIRYIQADIRDTDSVLDAAADFFGPERRVGLCLLLTAHFLDDDSLRHIFERLYAWAAPGSQIALSSVDYQSEDEGAKKASQTYRQQTGLQGFARSAEQMLQLVGPWQPYRDGLQPLENHAEANLGATVTLERRRGKLGYGGILIHP